MTAPAPALAARGVTTPALDSVTCADWRELVGALPNASVDLCLTDTPYGTTACAWDSVIDLGAWWAEMRRVMKPRGAVVMTASQPYTSVLVMSNLAWFRYGWVWEKDQVSNPQLAKVAPLKNYEDVLVFGERPPYFPQGTTPARIKRKPDSAGKRLGHLAESRSYVQETTNYPKAILRIPTERGLHPTQKPVALMTYMVLTYSEPGAVVLDPFVGSGTTALAARNTGRHYVCGDISPEYVAVALDRLRMPFEPRRVKANDDVSDLPLFAAGESSSAPVERESEVAR